MFASSPEAVPEIVPPLPPSPAKPEITAPLGVGPTVPTSIPSPALSRISLPTIVVPVASGPTSTPAVEVPAPGPLPLKATRLADPTASPPTVALATWDSRMPLDSFPRSPVPNTSVPTKFAAITTPVLAPPETRMPTPRSSGSVPRLLLPETRLRAVPPIVVFEVPSARRMPGPRFPTAVVPLASVPTKLPRTTVPVDASAMWMPCPSFAETTLRAPNAVPPIVVPCDEWTPTPAPAFPSGERPLDASPT